MKNKYIYDIYIFNLLILLFLGILFPFFWVGKGGNQMNEGRQRRNERERESACERDVWERLDGKDFF